MLLLLSRWWNNLLVMYLGGVMGCTRRKATWEPNGCHDIWILITIIDCDQQTHEQPDTRVTVVLYPIVTWYAQQRLILGCTATTALYKPHFASSGWWFFAEQSMQSKCAWDRCSCGTARVSSDGSFYSLVNKAGSGKNPPFIDGFPIEWWFLTSRGSLRADVMQVQKRKCTKVSRSNIKQKRRRSHAKYLDMALTGFSPSHAIMEPYPWNSIAFSIK